MGKKVALALIVIALVLGFASWRTGFSVYDGEFFGFFPMVNAIVVVGVVGIVVLLVVWRRGLGGNND